MPAQLPKFSSSEFSSPGSGGQREGAASLERGIGETAAPESPTARALLMDRVTALMFAGFVAALIAASLYWSDGAQPVLCRTDPPTLDLLSHLDVRMTVRGGVSCPVRARLSDPPVTRQEIVQPPQHGTAKPSGLHVVYYSPEPDFHGQDSFAIERHVSSSAYTGTSRVLVRVHVE